MNALKLKLTDAAKETETVTVLPGDTVTTSTYRIKYSEDGGLYVKHLKGGRITSIKFAEHGKKEKK